MVPDFNTIIYKLIILHSGYLSSLKTEQVTNLRDTDFGTYLVGYLLIYQYLILLT